MGADEFFTQSFGKTAEEAFKSARDEALHDYGHRGYTGSIAEKQRFTLISVPPECDDPQGFAQELLDKFDPRVDDKWGPAGCISLGDDRWLFFGWASS